MGGLMGAEGLGAKLGYAHTLRKYSDESVGEDLFSPPMKTMIRQMSEAMVRAMGVMMQAKRVSLPILAGWRWFEVGVRTAS